VYKYGFNGQEKDDEVYGAGNANTAEFWEYDCRLGRRFNVDPVTKVHQSNYSCLSNDPISRFDPNGDDDVTFNKDGTVKDVRVRSRFYEFLFGAKGKIVDENNKIIKKFKFNDKKDGDKDKWVGVNRIYEKVETISSTQVYDYIENQMPTAEQNVKDNGAIKGGIKNGIATGPFDYMSKPYNAAGNFIQSRNSLYIIGDVSYNEYDAGNLLTGASFRSMGWPTLVIRLGAHWNSIKHANSDNFGQPGYRPRAIGIQFDSRADQKAIRNGARMARKLHFMERMKGKGNWCHN
jgi:hypothetical protein